MAENNGAVLTREFVPPELHDRPYLKDYLDKPWDKTVGAEFFKKLDGAESLIGKRPAIPDPKTAKPEELDKFFEQFRPEKAEDYEVPGAGDEKVDQGFIKAVRAGLHAGKISKVQATGLLKAIAEYGAEVRKTQAGEQQRKAAEFDALAKSVLGEQNKTIMENTRKLIKELAPAAAQFSLDKLDDNQLVVMASIIQSIHKKYAPEDDSLTGKPGSAGSGGGQGGIEEKRTEMRTIMASKAYTNWQDAGHEAALKRVQTLAQEMAELQKA